MIHERTRRTDVRTDGHCMTAKTALMHMHRAVINGGVQYRCTFHKILIDNCWWWRWSTRVITRAAVVAAVHTISHAWHCDADASVTQWSRDDHRWWCKNASWGYRPVTYVLPLHICRATQCKHDLRRHAVFVCLSVRLSRSWTLSKFTCNLPPPLSEVKYSRWYIWLYRKTVHSLSKVV